jgi:hypothetical protein
MKYVIKNRRHDSVLYFTTVEEMAKDFCDYHNARYQTDDYYYEDYDPERNDFNV